MIDVPIHSTGYVESFGDRKSDMEFNGFFESSKVLRHNISGKKRAMAPCAFVMHTTFINIMLS